MVAETIGIASSVAQARNAALAAKVKYQAKVQETDFRAGVLKRQAIIQRHNAEIAQRNRRALLEDQGDQAREFGRVVSDAIGEEETRRSASGFAHDSASFARQRHSDRSRIQANLERMGRAYAAGDESLANRAYSAELAAYEADQTRHFERAQLPLHRFGADLGRAGAYLGAISDITSILGNAGAFDG